ncbi:MAG: hypothetical protein HQL01_09285 [Nitrospirae bacterium]|nr:hypothetical protein [Nitrospirota bacterium]
MIINLEEVRAKLNHAGNKGDCIEDDFRIFLSKYLPKRVTIHHGEIIDRYDNRSKQMDIVIMNDNHPSLFDSNSPGLFFIEGVAAVGEVKTALTSVELSNIIDNSKGFKQLKAIQPQGALFTTTASEHHYYINPPYFLVAYESQLTLETIYNKILESKEVKMLDAIFLLDRGYLINVGDGQGSFRMVDSNKKQLSGWSLNSSNELAVLVMWLSSVMPYTIGGMPVILPYF